MRSSRRLYGYDAAVGGRIRDAVRAAFGKRVRRIILFGSRARGEALPDSDYDLLVVLDTLNPAERHGIMLQLYAACRGSDATVESHPMSELEFAETRGVVGGLAYAAVKEGVVLYGRQPALARDTASRQVEVTAAVLSHAICFEHISRQALRPAETDPTMRKDDKPAAESRSPDHGRHGTGRPGDRGADWQIGRQRRASPKASASSS